MSDDAEIIPPKKSGAIASRERMLPARSDGGLRGPTGVVSSWLTAFGAKVQAEAYKEIAANIRAQKEALDAEHDRRKSALKLLRATGELEEAPDILALDRAARKAERTEKYAELSARYEQIDDEREERAHQRELRKRQRQRELEEANRDIVEAQRQTFASTEGFEKQERLKKLNLEIWETRKATKQMDAELVWTKLHQELEGTKSPEKPENGEEGTLVDLAELRIALSTLSHEAAASGDASGAQKYAQLAKDLDEQAVAAMREASK
jgi:hypothetical protein